MDFGQLDYAFISPVWQSISKTELEAAFGSDELMASLATASMAVIALGGMCIEFSGLHYISTPQSCNHCPVNIDHLHHRALLHHACRGRCVKDSCSNAFGIPRRGGSGGCVEQPRPPARLQGPSTCVQ